MQNVLRAAEEFQLEGQFLSITEIPSGNINNTYQLTYQQADGMKRLYTLQHLNTYVFKTPELVMHNIDRVTNHLKKKLEVLGQCPDRRVLHVVHTKTNQPLYVASGGECWRAYIYIDNATAYDMVEKPEQFYEAGYAFGEFQCMLSDFPAETLHSTIPNFHNTRARVEVFKDAVKNNLASRASSIADEIEFVMSRSKRAGRIVEMLESNDLALRVTHNDTKINNVLIDDETGKAICVIDLDTVMPGSSLYDYGDAIRNGASTAAEDEKDLSKVSLDIEMFKQFTAGFLKAIKGFLPDSEIRLLPLGIWTITYELGMRFLTDYLDGDKYFKTQYPGHNLVRARAQQKLLSDIESKEALMQQIIEEML